MPNNQGFGVVVLFRLQLRAPDRLRLLVFTWRQVVQTYVNAQRTYCPHCAVFSFFHEHIVISRPRRQAESTFLFLRGSEFSAQKKTEMERVEPRMGRHCIVRTRF